MYTDYNLNLLKRTKLSHLILSIFQIPNVANYFNRSVNTLFIISENTLKIILDRRVIEIRFLKFDTIINAMVLVVNYATSLAQCTNPPHNHA